MAIRILIADENDDVRGLIAGWLQEAGFTCLTTGADAAVPESRRFRPAAAIVGVAAADGGDRLHVVRSLVRDGDAAVIVISQPDIELALEAESLGASDCLPWPSTRGGVLASLGRALGERRTDWQSSAVRGTRDAVAGQCQQLKALVRGLQPDAARVALLAVLDERVPGLREHAERVADCAVEIACSLGARADLIGQIRSAALLQDVGKAAMPPGLLAHRGPLSDEQVSIMRTHVTLTEEILATVPGCGQVAAIAGATHERFDGRGYPMSLRGSEIPVEARLIAVANAYVTLTSACADRDPATGDEVHADLARMAGAQLDPDLVRACLRASEAARC